MNLGDRAPCASLLLAALLLLAASALTAAVDCPSGAGDVINLTSGADLYTAFSNNGTGKTYRLAAGNYTIADQIVVNIPSRTTCFIGIASGQVVVTKTTTSNYFSIDGGESVLSLQNIIFDGPGATCVDITGGGLEMYNVVIQGFSRALQATDDVEDIQLTSVIFRNNGVDGGTTCTLRPADGAAWNFAWHDVEFSNNRNIGLLVDVNGGSGSVSLLINGRADFINNGGGAIIGLGLSNSVQLVFTGQAAFFYNSKLGDGGAIYLDGASVTFLGDLDMQANIAQGNGGAIAVVNGSSLVVGRAYLYSNAAISSSPVQGSAIPGLGGALYVSTSNISTSNTVVSFVGPLVVLDNIAEGSGGAFYISGPDSGAPLSYVTISTDKESVFKNNIAYLAPNITVAVGGAMAMTSGTVFQVTGSGSICIQYNTAATSGGGIHSTGRVLLNSTGIINMADNSPGDILIESAGAVECPSTSLYAGTYYITGPVCACANANNGNSTCGCPQGYLWEGPKCSCTLTDICGNVNGTGVPYQCTGNWVYNPAAANNPDISPTSCCLWAATCQSGYIDSNRACERGVYNRTAGNQLNPSLYTCCQDSCADSNIRSSPAQPWKCTRGAYDSSKARSAKPSNSVCCQPTCGDINLSSPTPIRYNCTGQWQFNPLSADSTVLSRESCCTPTDDKLIMSLRLNASAPVVAVGDSVNFTITVAAEGAAVAEVVVKAVFPTGLSVETAGLPAECAANPASTVVCNLGSFAVGQNKTVVIRAAAAAAGNYTVEASLVKPSVPDPSTVKATANVIVQGACCNSTTGLCQAAATAVDCVGGSFLQDKSCATATCPAPNGSGSLTITRTTSVDANTLAVGDVVDVDLVVKAGKTAAKAVTALIAVTSKLQFAGTSSRTVGTWAEGCKVETFTPKNKKTGVTQRLSCTLGPMRKGQTKSFKVSIRVLEAGAATIKSRVASTSPSSTDQDVLTLNSLGACCMSSNAKIPSCSDMAPANCIAARGQPRTKQSCAQAAC